MQDVIDIILRQHLIAHWSKVTATAERAFFRDFTARNARWDHDPSIARIIGQSFLAESSKPVIGIVHGVVSDEYFRDPPSFERRGSPKINQANVYSHPLSGCDPHICWIGDIAVPNIRSLINLELLRIVVDAAQIAQLRAQGLSWKKIAKAMGLGVGTLYRVAPANKPTC
jgi:hypothetical protein